MSSCISKGIFYTNKVVRYFLLEKQRFIEQPSPNHEGQLLDREQNSNWTPISDHM